MNLLNTTYLYYVFVRQFLCIGQIELTIEENVHVAKYHPRITSNIILNRHLDRLLRVETRLSLYKSSWNCEKAFTFYRSLTLLGTLKTSDHAGTSKRRLQNVAVSNQKI